MGRFRRTRVWLILTAVMFLAVSAVLSAYFMHFHAETVSLYRQAEENFRRGDAHSRALAASQLRQVIREDREREQAYWMLGRIAEAEERYREQAVYDGKACELNPLNREYREHYLNGLLHTRDFERLSDLFATVRSTEREEDLWLYSVISSGRRDEHTLHLLRDGSPDERVSPLRRLMRILCPEAGFEPETALAALAALKTEVPADDFFVLQEILVAVSTLHLSRGEYERAEAVLEEGYRLNASVFAPSLGQFYADHRSLGQAVAVYEQYLGKTSDAGAALMLAEWYCLLGKTDKIAALRKEYRSIRGEGGVICNCYFDVLMSYALNERRKMKQSLSALRGRIRTPFAQYLYLGAEIEEKSYSGALQSYEAFRRQPRFPGLQERADRMVLEFVKRSIPEEIGPTVNQNLVRLATALHAHQKDVVVMKYLLLSERVGGEVNHALLTEARTAFPDDLGLLKIELESCLQSEPQRARELLDTYRKQFPEQSDDLFGYEWLLARRSGDQEKASALFRARFVPEMLPYYWEFALETGRKDDLRFLSRAEVYRPFCEAALALAEGRKDAALALLAKSDAKGEEALLFFAAKTLGEHGRWKDALEKYALFPAGSAYERVVQLNRAEILAEAGDVPESLELAHQAYLQAPDAPETQLCYADKLLRAGRGAEIAEMTLSFFPDRPLYRELRGVWIAGMEAAIHAADASGAREKLRLLCVRLLMEEPRNRIGQEFRKKAESLPPDTVPEDAVVPESE